MSTRLSFLALALAAPLAAQSFVVPAGTDPAVGTCNAYPFGTSDMRYQALIPAADLGNAPGVIAGFSLSPCSSGVRMMQSITVKLAEYSGTTMTTTFDTNLNSPGPAVTVLDQLDYEWRMVANTWNDIGLQVPFPYSGANALVVEILVRGSSGVSGSTHREGTHQRMYAGSYSGQTTGSSSTAAFKMRVLMGDASTQTFGSGCQGSNGLVPEFSLSGTAQLGTNLDFVCSDTLASTGVLFLIGTNNQQPVFPFDLTGVGAPGCRLYHAIGAQVFAPADSLGTARLTLPLPADPNLVYIAVYASALVFDGGANAAGAVTTNYGRILLGN